MAGASFKVQGELVLVEGGFVAGANAGRAALDGLSAAGRKLADTSTAVATATGQATQAQAAATVSAKSQADGFARLAQQQAADAARARSQALMTSVEQSGQQLQAVFGAATRAQVAELAKGTSASQAYETAQTRVRVANDNTAGSIERQNKALTQQRIQLSYQLNDIFVQLASGQGVFRTAVQQGPQITQLYGGIGNALRAIPLAAAAYATGIALVVGATIGAVVHLETLTAQERQAENALQATGRAAQVTAGQLQLLVQAEARRPGANREETQQGALQLLSNNRITGEAVQRTLGLARDLARVTGTDLPTAASALSSGLDGTVAGAKKLDATFNALTPAELEQIRRFEEMGQKGAAVGVVLTALERHLKGANERGLSPATLAVNELSKAWSNFADNVAKSGATRGLAFVATEILKGATAFVSGRGPEATPGGGPTAEDVAKTRASLEAEKKNLLALQGEFARASSDFQRSQINRSLTASEARIRDMQANVSQLEGKASTVTAKAVQDQVTSEATALKNEVKDAIAVLDKSVTVAGQRRALENERAQIEKSTKSGLLDPDTLARAQERITQIDGQLKGLRTPAEELQRGLDLESTLAKLPTHLQAAERAYLETKKRVLEQGGTLEEANRAANQARANVLQTQATATGQQIQLLSAEAEAALRVAAAYGTSRASALQLAAQLKAQAAEQQGSIAGGTAGEVAQRTLEEQAAGAVAASAEKNEAYAREVAGLERLVDAEGRSSAAARETERANKVATYAEDLRAQAAATNNATIIAAAERQIATYDRLSRAAMAAEIRRDANALNRQYDPNVAYDEEMAKLQELQATGLLTSRAIEEYTRASEQRRLEASRDATDGMIAGLRRYAQEANNAGQAASQGVTAGLRTIEDTLVQVATTGQITFSQLANSIIADLARIAIRQSITGPISQAFAGIPWGSFFSGGSTVPSIGTGTGYTYHKGGIVGRDGTPRSGVSPDLWINAPRYHGGGLVAGERAIIAQDDEEVLTTSNPRHRWNVGRGGAGGGAAGGVVLEVDFAVNNYSNERVRSEQGTGAGGKPMFRVIVGQVKDEIAADITQGRGTIVKSIAGRFNLNPAPRT